MQELISKVIEHFYARALNDIFLGYHFKKIGAEKFQIEHIPRINQFWSFHLLRSGINPEVELIKAHLPLNIKKGEIGRWLVLFHESLGHFEATEISPEAQSFLTVWKRKADQFASALKQSPALFPKKL